MSTPLGYETPELDELRNLADAAWRLDLEGLQVPELDADDEEPEHLAEPVSFVLPYRAAYERYMTHLTGCTGCADTPVWDVSCERGMELAHAAADAMALMQENGSLN